MMPHYISASPALPGDCRGSGLHESRSASVSHHPKHDSKVSITTKNSVRSARSHQEYLDSLIPPSQEMLERISTVQEQKEEEAIHKRLSVENPQLTEDERTKAAGLIQRNYRGYRERRQLEGMGLDPSTRWVEAIKEARYRNLTQPRPRASVDGARTSIESNGPQGGAGTTGAGRPSTAKQNWKKIGLIARRAGGDEDSDDSSSDDDDTPEDQREERRRKRAEAKLVRQKAAKMMDLQYFLEMVDLKHRYGSNLRTYHQEWKKADTNENFFYWLDYGEGRFINCKGCSRDRLDREQVRYLSKEERLDYLVHFDKEGCLVWAKNGARIDTTEKYKDSIHGIVPNTDSTPAYVPAKAEAATGLHYGHSLSGASSISEESEDHNDEAEEAARANKYATPELDNSRGMKKVKHVSASTIFNKLLRGSVKKNTWIFVADTSFRLYVGIKQSGAFQHSSFLHGSRISAAGLIKIKDGHLSMLSPLSGHYRPPVSSFRGFIGSMMDAGVDMSHVSISQSYAVLVGLEAYVKSRQRGKKIIQKLIQSRHKLLSPDELRMREEEKRDESKSAERERRFLEMRQQAEEEEREENRANIKLLHKLHIRPKISNHSVDSAAEPVKKGEREGEKEKEVDIEAPGRALENTIALEGIRDE